MELYTGLLAPIIVGAIAGLASIIVALINNRKIDSTAKQTNNELKKTDCRTQIMLLIMQDRDAVRDGKLPENRKDVEELYDKYTEMGGNSHIKRKYNEYCEWYESIKVESQC